MCIEINRIIIELLIDDQTLERAMLSIKAREKLLQQLVVLQTDKPLTLHQIDQIVVLQTRPQQDV